MSNSKFIQIFGSKMHYLEDGVGDPILFLHGVPTSSYLWRNIIKVLAKSARCLAPDLIGMGDSDKPQIEYSLFDHIKYIEQFIDALQLKNVTFVMHGLGSAIGFDYAMRHAKNVKGLAFYESHVKPATTWDQLSLPIQDILHFLENSEDKGREKVTKDNSFINKLLMNLSLSKLSDTDITQYNKPFQAPDHRQPLWQYYRDFSFGENNQRVFETINHYSEKLTKSPVPKLLLFSTPGFMTTMDTVQWCNDNLSNLDIVDLEEGLHLAQESNPKLFAELLHDWYINIR